MELSLSDSKLLRWFDLPAALLLLAGLLTATIRLAATNWTDELALVQIVGVCGLMVGLALGQSVFSRRVVVLLALMYGLFILGWQLGSTLGEGILWSERITSVGGRLGVSLLQLIQRKPVNDPMLFLGVMSLLFWILSVHAGYSLTRHAHPWQATLPMGLALFIIHIHDPYWPFRTWFLATYVFFALLLLARTTYLQNQAVWKRMHTRLPPYLGLDLIRATLLATAVLVLLAWTVPALASSVPLAERAWKQVSRPWTLARSRMSNAFASLRASVGLVYDYYGDVLPLGRGNKLTDDVVMTVEAPARPEAVRRFYWRARVYDTYENGLWDSNFDESQDLTPENFDLQFPELGGRWDANFEITPLVPLSTLFTVPQPQWVSRPVRIDLIPIGDGSMDLGAIHSEINVQAGETYAVRSSIAAATESELRNAGLDYPAWIQDRYRQLPDSITQRTKDLAERITRPFDNPYDKAVAITNYLRNNIRYSDTVPVPPSDQDPVDWVLFDLQQGFCNYYATAEIVMLRAVGIPARWAVGYAEGEYNPEASTYTVRQRDAHSWPEVYFPGFGWIEFEPTLSQPNLERPMGELNPADEENNLANPFNPDQSPGLQDGLDEILGLERAEEIDLAAADQAQGNPLFAVILLVVALGLIGVSLFAWRTGRVHFLRPIPMVLETGMLRFGLRPPRFLRRWATSARLSALERAYNEINHGLSRIGVLPGPQATPSERAETLSRLLPAAAEPAYALVREYEYSVYSHSLRGDLDRALEASRTIRRLSWLARLQRLVSRWQEPPQPARRPPITA